jgi:transcriptional regulator with XRE-family HTH domain
VECGASHREHQGMPISSPSAQEAALVAFGKAIRAQRAELGVSQEELALRSGIDRSYLGAIERGEQNVGLLHLIRIASALGVSLTKIVGEAGL